MVSGRTVADILRGKKEEYRPGTLARLEVALDWEVDSVRDILNGGEPRPKAPQRAGGVIDAIRGDEELYEEDKRALIRHYVGLLEFARKRRAFETDDGPPVDPSFGRGVTGESDDPDLSPHNGEPEPAND